MPRAQVKLTVKAADGRRWETEWFFTFSSAHTFAEVAEEGCRRLGISNTFMFNVYEMEPFSAFRDPPRKLYMDEIVKDGRSYHVLDQRLSGDDESTSSTASAPESSFHASTRSTSSTASVPESSSHALTQPASSTASAPVSSLHASTQPTSSHPSVGYDVRASLQPSYQPPSANDATSRPPNDRTGATTISRRMVLAQHYTDHQDTVDLAYASYVYDPPLFLGNTNILQFFGDRAVAKAAVYILKSSRTAGQRLYNAAVHMVEKTAKEMLHQEYPTFVVEKAVLENFAANLNTLTSTNLFYNLTLSNGQGFADRYLRTQRRQNPTNATPSRRSRGTPPNVNIEPLSAAASAETDLPTLHRIHAASSNVFLHWMARLKTDPAYVSGIVSHVLSKFGHLKRDTSILHVHFKNFMKNDPRLSFNLAELYRSMLDNIQSSAMAAQPTTAALPADPNQKEFRAGALLALVIAKSIRSRKVDYGRLVLDFTHTSNFHDAILQKNEMGITAPVIVALGTHPENTFYICVDDDILRVRGQFGDALQSLMEIANLFNLAYDKQTIGITYFLEAMMGMNHQLTSGRQQLLNVLLPRTRNHHPTAASTSNDPSNDSPDMAFSQSSNLDPSTSSSTPQYDEEFFLQMFEEPPHESSTPIRKRPAQSHRVDGKRRCRAPITASALHSAVQQTVPQESSSDTPTSSQLHDRDPSPSIFD